MRLREMSLTLRMYNRLSVQMWQKFFCLFVCLFACLFFYVVLFCFEF